MLQFHFQLHWKWNRRLILLLGYYTIQPSYMSSNKICSLSCMFSKNIKVLSQGEAWVGATLPSHLTHMHPTGHLPQTKLVTDSSPPQLQTSDMCSGTKLCLTSLKIKTRTSLSPGQVQRRVTLDHLQQWKNQEIAFRIRRDWLQQEKHMKLWKLLQT